MISLLTSPPQSPFPWARVMLAIAGVWLAPVVLGVLGLAVFASLDESVGDPGLALWFFSYALLLSPVFSLIGWAIALPALWLALSRGWFGWLPALAIGAAAGLLAQGVVDSELALPFGIAALLALRLVLGRILPL